MEEAGQVVMWDNILFFPGVIVHELAHILACLVTGTKVTGIKLWGLKEAYVKHEEPGPLPMLIIAVAPFLFNTLLAVSTLYLGHMFLKSHQSFEIVLVAYWFSASLAYHAFPSLDDVNNAYQVLTRNWFSSMLGRKGFLNAVLSWLLFVPVFLPLLALIGLMYIFSQIDKLGLVWFILLFLITARIVGL